MAVGARITSENLSGKTATVTFIPYTGATSGTTVNLGTKTIPFNNINTHPYGVYNLYFAEYDYTYSLTVDQPATSVQSFVYQNRMINSDNYGAAFLNFNDFTAEIIDLGVDTNVWNNRDIYVLDNSGYMYYFDGVDNNDDRLVIFTNAIHEEIGRYSGTTNGNNRDDLDGKWVTFEDEDNFYVITIRPANYNIYCGWIYGVGGGTTFSIGVEHDCMPTPSYSKPLYLAMGYNDITKILKFYWSFGTEDSCHLIYETTSSFDINYVGVTTRNALQGSRHYIYGAYDPDPPWWCTACAENVDYPRVIMKVNGFRTEKLISTSTEDEIGPDFTLNKYKILPYEHGAAMQECFHSEKAIPYFLGPQLMNLRNRRVPLSGSFG